MSPEHLQTLEPADAASALEELRLSLSARPQVRRTRELIEREYARDKYGRVLARCPASIDEASALLLTCCGIDPLFVRIVTLEQRLARMPLRSALRCHDQILDQALARAVEAFRPQFLCELGCGFGAHLARHRPLSYGGDIAGSAVELGRKLGIDVTPFDFHEPASYNFIRPGSLVFTCAAIEQLPSAMAVIENLRKQRQKIVGVVHFEPTFRSEREGELGRLQNEYMRRCDYNMDLEEALQQPDIAIVDARYDLIGVNPLNPASLFVWKFLPDEDVVGRACRAKSTPAGSEVDERQ